VRFLNATQNPPNQAVTLTLGQPLSNGNDFVNAQLPNNEGLGSTPSPFPPGGNAALYIGALYRKILQREAEPAALAAWVELLNSGMSRASIVQALWESPEHRGIQVDQFYATYLHRVADPVGRSGWVNALMHGMSEADVVRGFLTSAEYFQAHADTTAYVTALYTDVLGRRPDASGLAAWQQAAQSGLSRVALADAFIQSPEEAHQLVDQSYARYLVRAADVSEKQAWTGMLLAQRLTQEQVAQAFLAADEFFARATGAL
jgi:hypothetical protein